ncbi:hypothetical protein CIK05_09560 [Bdellovibrio sp. qaytius]|nr:hypothetical protein CIK05_09560 [Bdellovibrio sp. qaytius]
MRNIRVRVSIGILLGITLFGFQNCAPGNQPLSAVDSSTDASDAISAVDQSKSVKRIPASTQSSSQTATASAAASTSQVKAPTTPAKTPVKTPVAPAKTPAVTQAAPKIGVPQGVSIVKDGKGICNSVSFTQVPTDSNYFIGRILNGSTPGACDGTNWSLALFKMTWETNTLSFVKYVFKPDVTDAAGNKIESAYDPHIVQFNNEMWVAFECAGPFGIGASSCIAPFTIANGLDTNRLSVIVRGTYNATKTEVYSASVPKLLAFKNKLYIYWTACHFDVNKDGGLVLLSVASRGAEVAQDSSAQKKMWIKDSAGVSMYAGDAAKSIEVWGGTPGDVTANHVSDIFDFYVKGDTIYAVGAVGGFGCITPLSPIYACYRTRIASSTTPLGFQIFNKNYVNSPALPFNPMEYVRFFKMPNGSQFMMGQHTTANLNGSNPVTPVIAPGYQKYSIDLNNLKTVAANGDNPKPNPTVSALTLSATFTVVQLFHRSCGYTLSNDVACNAASSRYCQSQGYLSGTGVLQHYIDNMTVACVGSSAGTQLNVNLSELSSINSDCTQISTATGSCQSAVYHYCQNKGYAGGYGPQEAGGNNLTVTCLKASNSFSISSTFTALTEKVSACSQAVPGSDSCRAAADLMCKAQGGVAGYGLVDYAGNNVAIGCIK